MPPIALPRTPSGEIIRKVSRSISESLSSTPHSSSPSIARRAITNIASHFSTRHAPASAPLPATVLKIARRQTQILAIPTTYEGLNAGPPPGTVVGITLGAVGGFLLLLWLIYTCANFGGGRPFSSFSWGRRGRDTVIEEEVIRRRSRSASRSRSVSRSMSEVSRPAPEPRRRESRRTTVVEETRRTSTREPEIEREEDIVEVIEEHSPVRRKTGSRRESNRVSSGFRTVDPAEFGGGDRPVRKVSRR